MSMIRQDYPADGRLIAVHRASHELQAMLRPEDMAREVIRVLEDTLAYEYASALLIEEDTNRLIPLALSDQGQGPEFVAQDKEFLKSHNLRVGNGIIGWVAEHGRSILIGDVREDPRYYPIRENIRSEICVPIRIGEKVLGVIDMESTRVDAYTLDDARVLETVAAQFAVAYMAVMDVLTAAHNRGCFETAGGQEVRRAQRFERPISLLVVDIDDFKQVNDTHGHTVGDCVLRSLAREIAKEIRETDLLGRIGGDEFALLLPETDAKRARMVAQRIKKRLTKMKVECGPSRVEVSVSIGHATLSEHMADLAALVEAGDADMYRNKKAPKGKKTSHRQ